MDKNNTAQTPVAPVTPVTSSPQPVAPPVAPVMPITPPVTPITPPTPIQPKKSFPKKIILAVIVLLLIIVLAITGTYFLTKKEAVKTDTQPTAKLVPTATPSPTPIPDSTSDWQIYTSTPSAFSIKYPPEFRTTTTGPALNIVDKTGQFNLVIATDSSDLDLKNYVDQKSWCVSIKSKTGQSYTLGGENALRFEKTPCGQVGTTDLYAVHGGIAYHLSIATQENYDSSLATLNQILSTFIFTQ